MKRQITTKCLTRQKLQLMKLLIAKNAVNFCLLSKNLSVGLKTFHIHSLCGICWGFCTKKLERKKSSDAYHNALLINPDYAEAYFNIGNSLFHQGLFEEAEKAFAKAAKLQPKNARNFFNLAHVHNEQGKIETAENDLQTAIELDENYAEAFHLLAQIYHKKGAIDLALSNFEKSISSKPDYPEAYNNMSNVLWDLGRAEEAIEALERAVTLKPSLFGAASKKAYFLASKNICGTKCYLDEAKAFKSKNKKNLATPFVFEKKHQTLMTKSDWDLFQEISEIILLVIF